MPFLSKNSAAAAVMAALLLAPVAQASEGHLAKPQAASLRRPRDRRRTARS